MAVETALPVFIGYTERNVRDGKSVRMLGDGKSVPVYGVGKSVPVRRLGSPMTSADILEGVLRATALIAITHPAEFIELTFQQQQKT